jgi:hypothetical protein
MGDDNVNMYIAAGIIGVLIILLIAQCIKNDRYDYSETDCIMVKTGKGVIKTNSATLAREIKDVIIIINNNRCNNIDYLLVPASAHLDEFIRINPISGNAELFEIKSQIVHADYDLSSGIMSDVNNAISPYDNFCKKLRIVHQMLTHKLCNGGILDYKTIEHIAYECSKKINIEYENNV